MGAMLFPLLVVVTAALAVIGFFLVTRYPVSTWRAGLRNLGEAALEKEEPVEVVPQDVHLNDLMTREARRCTPVPTPSPGWSASSRRP